MRNIRCVWCNAKITTKDEVGLNLKILGSGSPDYYCMDCLSEYLGCTVQDLEDKIEQFKEEGCTLFG